MSVIIRLQNLPWSANALDIRGFFTGLGIPEGGVHIVGGEMGDAFIAFSTDEDARQAMKLDYGKLKETQVRLLLSSRSEMQKVIETARQSSVSFVTLAPTVVVKPVVPAIISQLQPPIISSSLSGLLTQQITQQSSDLNATTDTKVAKQSGYNSVSEKSSKDGDSDRDKKRDSFDRRDRNRKSRSRSRDRRRSRSRSRDRNSSSRRRRRSRSRSRDRRRRRHSSSRERSRDRSRERNSRNRRDRKTSIDNKMNVVPPQAVMVVEQQKSIPANQLSGWNVLQQHPPPIPPPQIQPYIAPMNQIINANNFNLPPPPTAPLQPPKIYNTEDLTTLQKLDNMRNPGAFQSIPPPNNESTMPAFVTNMQPFIRPNFQKTGLNASGGNNNNTSVSSALSAMQTQSTGQYSNFQPSNADLVMGKCIKVSNMNRSTGYGEIRRFFAGLQINQNGIKMINDKFGRRTGTAFIRFVRFDSKKIALDKTGSTIRDSIIDVAHISKDEFEVAVDAFKPEYNNENRDNNRFRNSGGGNGSDDEDDNNDSSEIDYYRNNDDSLDDIYKNSGNTDCFGRDRRSGTAVNDLDRDQRSNKTIIINNDDDNEDMDDMNDDDLQIVLDPNGKKGVGDDSKLSDPIFTTLLVQDIPPFSKEQDIMKIFSDYPLVHILLCKAKDKTNQAFAKFHRAEDAKEALGKRSTHIIAHRTVVVTNVEDSVYEQIKEESEREVIIDDDESVVIVPSPISNIDDNSNSQSNQQLSFPTDPRQQHRNYQNMNSGNSNNNDGGDGMMPWQQNNWGRNSNNNSNDSFIYNRSDPRINRMNEDNNRFNNNFNNERFNPQFNNNDNSNNSNSFNNNSMMRSNDPRSRGNLHNLNNNNSNNNDQSNSNDFCNNKDPRLRTRFDNVNNNNNINNTDPRLRSLGDPRVRNNVNNSNINDPRLQQQKDNQQHHQNQQQQHIQEQQQLHTNQQLQQQLYPQEHEQHNQQEQLHNQQEQKQIQQQQIIEISPIINNEPIIEEPNIPTSTINTPQQQTDSGDEIISNCTAISNLETKTTDRDVIDFFSDIGLVPNKVHILLNTEGIPSGDCFCEFHTNDDALRAVTKNNSHLGVNMVNVQLIAVEKVDDILSSFKTKEPKFQDTNIQPESNRPSSNASGSNHSFGNNRRGDRSGNGDGDGYNNRGGGNNNYHQRGGFNNNTNNRADFNNESYDRGNNNNFNERSSLNNNSNDRGFNNNYNDRGGQNNNFNDRGSQHGNFNARGGHNNSNNRGGQNNNYNDRGGHNNFNNRGGQNNNFNDRDSQNSKFNARGGQNNFNDRGGPNNNFNNRDDVSSNNDFNDRSGFNNNNYDRGGRGGGGFNNQRDGPPRNMGAGRNNNMGYNNENNMRNNNNGPRSQFNDMEMSNNNSNQQQPQQNNINNTSCIVSMENVPYRAGAEDILDFFDGFQISKADVMRRYNDNGTPTGDARVCFESASEARRAIEVTRLCKIIGRPIHLTLLDDIK